MSVLSCPESVLVVIHTPALDCLLLERLNPAGFWQSVTGTLRWRETAAECAAREVREETGIDSGNYAGGLVDADLVQRFPILPEWRDRYGPEVTENLEHLWYLPVPEILPVTLNPDEHLQHRWLPLDKAISTVTSWTNRAALEKLRQ